MFVQLKEFPDHLITDTGEIISTKQGRWKPLAGGINSAGYNVVSLSYIDKQYRKTIHQLVAEAFLGPRPEGLDINHKDGNKQNNNLDNLEYITRQGNARHAWDNGLHENTRAKFKSNRNRKLTDDDIVKLRSLKGTMYQKEAAALFNINQAYVSAIWSGKHRG